MTLIECWCGSTVEHGRMHYPGGDPENGPAHEPQLEVDMLVARAYDSLSGYPDEVLGAVTKEYMVEMVHSSFDGWPEEEIPVVKQVVADFMRYLLAR